MLGVFPRLLALEADPFALLLAMLLLLGPANAPPAVAGGAMAGGGVRPSRAGEGTAGGLPVHAELVLLAMRTRLVLLADCTKLSLLMFLRKGRIVTQSKNRCCRPLH
jgi:hypothetical protein